jgi:hypothetical protein
MTKDELIKQLVVHSHDHAAIETSVTSAQVAKASMRAALNVQRYFGWDGG